jgi:hypothetical protein
VQIAYLSAEVTGYEVARCGECRFVVLDVLSRLRLAAKLCLKVLVPPWRHQHLSQQLAPDFRVSFISVFMPVLQPGRQFLRLPLVRGRLYLRGNEPFHAIITFTDGGIISNAEDGCRNYWDGGCRDRCHCR